MKKRWIEIFKDELRLLFDDKGILLTVIVAPILYAFFIGSIYMDKEVSDIPLAVVDMDHSSLSRKVSQLVDSSEKVEVKGHFSTMEEAMYYFNNLDVQGILLIPKGFQKKTMNLDGAKVELILNNTKFLTSNELNKGVQQVLLTVDGGVRMQYFVSNKIPVELAKQKAQPILPVIKSIYNPTNNYGDYLLPILLILILQQTLIIGFGQSAVHEYKHGLLANLGNISFHNFMKVFSAKSFYYIILYAVYFFIFFKLIFTHYNLAFKGPLLLHIVLGLIFLLVVVLYVIFLTTFFRTSIGWTEVMAFSTYPLFLVSGYSWPVEAMPKFLQFFTNLLPATPYYKMFNMLSVQGASFRDIIPEFVHLLFLLLFGYFLIFIRFRFLKFKKRDTL